MGKIIRMTEEVISKNYDEEKAVAMAKSAPEEKELPFAPAPIVGRGFASFKEHINRRGRPPKENRKKQINLRIDSDIVEFFQTRVQAPDGKPESTTVYEKLFNCVK